jgi:hypothetical protein
MPPPSVTEQIKLEIEKCQKRSAETNTQLLNPIEKRLDQIWSTIQNLDHLIRGNPGDSNSHGLAHEVHTNSKLCRNRRKFSFMIVTACVTAMVVAVVGAAVTVLTNLSMHP